MFRCPKCKRTDGIEIAAVVWVAVSEDDDDGVETEISRIDGSHEWDDDSVARCHKCGATGTVLTFDDEEEA